MKIDFEDGSFLTLYPSDNHAEQLTLVTCGKKDRNTTTMSASDLSAAQAGDLVEFVLKWLESLSDEQKNT